MTEPLSEVELVEKGLRSCALAWRRAATTSEIRDKVTLYLRAADTLNQLQADLKRAEDAHANECEKLGVVSLLPEKWRESAEQIRIAKQVIVSFGERATMEERAVGLDERADELERALGGE